MVDPFDAKQRRPDESCTMTDQEQLERLRALCELQRAEILSAHLCLLGIASYVRRQAPDLPDMNELYVRFRKQFLQRKLEELEISDPALAARLLDLIDSSSTNFPPTYE
jgi:hypothetical protein